MGKIQVRFGCFETNSSSAHTLTVFDKDDWEEFKEGERVISANPYDLHLIKTTEAKKIYDPKISYSYSYDDFMFYDNWKNHMDFDIIEEDIADKHVVSIYRETY